MTPPFSPSFVKFQADIEAYLVAQGKRERTRDGFIVFRGYDSALKHMFGRYLKASAFEPLVAHFQTWNWEHSYNDYLLSLTRSLRAKRDWTLLNRLWSGVIAKRRRLYNDIRKLERKSPGTVPATSVRNSRVKFLESLRRVRSYSIELGSPEETEAFEKMISRVKDGKSA